MQQYSAPAKLSGPDRNVPLTPQQQQQEGLLFPCLVLFCFNLGVKNCRCDNFLLISEYALLFATLIVRCAKDIDVLIESLPSEDSSTELQVWV